MTKEKKYDNLFMDIAIRSSEMSYCERAKVGSVIVKDNRVVVNAWNGTCTGSNNGCEQETLRCQGCNTRFDEDNFNGNYQCPHCNNKVSKGTKTKNNVVHAEANCLIFAAKNGIKTDGCTMYVTLSPCIECAKLIVQSGVKRVVYGSDYRKSEGIIFLEDNGVKTENIKEKNDQC